MRASLSFSMAATTTPSRSSADDGSYCRGETPRILLTRALTFETPVWFRQPRLLVKMEYPLRNHPARGSWIDLGLAERRTLGYRLVPIASDS